MPKKTKKMKVDKMRAEIIETLKTADEKTITRVYETLTGRLTEKGRVEGDIEIRLIT